MGLRNLIKVIESKGFYFVRQKGTHRIYSNDHHSIVVPMKDGDRIGKGLETKILKQLQKYSKD